jgi:SAM-dependent methyltransferase
MLIVGSEMADSTDASTYDQLPYPSLAHIWTHPARLHVAARVLGLSPAPLERCRVLEIGCGDGTNLIAMAGALPEAEFVGFDYTAGHIATGRATAAAIGVTNVRLEQADARDFGAGEEPFDYIIAHGVYSWVPPDVRVAVLRLCRRLLAPQGIAHISYNTLPGSAPLMAMRSIVRVHTRGIEEPLERLRQSRELADFLARRVPDDGRIYPKMVQMFADDLNNREPEVTLHDDLAEINDPCYFLDFVAEAEAEGLSYLHDARFSDVMQVRFDQPTMEELLAISRDSAHAEQISDFLFNRSFRRSLLCHEEREAEARMELTAAALAGFHLRGEFRADADNPGRIRSVIGPILTPAAPVGAAALAIVGEHFPAAVPFERLVEEARARAGSEDPAADADVVAATIILAYSVRSEMITPWPCVPGFTAEIAERPAVGAFNRRRVAIGERVLTDAFHAQKEVAPVAFALIPVLDGTRDFAALVAHLAAQFPDASATQCEADLAVALAQLAEAAMLVPSGPVSEWALR